MSFFIRISYGNKFNLKTLEPYRERRESFFLFMFFVRKKFRCDVYLQPGNGNDSLAQLVRATDS
jgi:hypothetical protein